MFNTWNKTEHISEIRQTKKKYNQHYTHRSGFISFIFRCRVRHRLSQVVYYWYCGLVFIKLILSKYWVLVLILFHFISKGCIAWFMSLPCDLQIDLGDQTLKRKSICHSRLSNFLHIHFILQLMVYKQFVTNVCFYF